MNGWRFALQRRWFGYLGAAIIFAIACILLSMWQVGRRDEAVDAINLINRNYDSQTQPIDDVLKTPTAFSPSQTWKPVLVTGTYLVDRQLLVRNRPYNGDAGFEILTPLQRADGSIFIVDRGWVVGGAEQDLPDTVPTPPSGTVSVVVHLKPGEPNLPGRSAPAGQVATINLPTVAGKLDATTYTGAYGLLITETPAAAGQMPSPAVKPELDEGPHLSYAIQWVVFAVFGFFGLGYALRTEYRIRNADDPEERERARERDRKAREKSERAPSDSEVEDAMIESAARR
ncbi:SURF1 family protein [Glaciihabitans sp. dw_435]|uniref:SURF1 family cytochrome oxidase biogenesis protein n=1 Tax=Glaciihabitans sp. dw_435 TaxID=2720081 RepID=UPI001BD4B8AC|nr:SURF1 family protein [Glaciihabitans sp. dw_435]